MFDVKVDRIKLPGDHVLHVVRDDLLGGGTKERACHPFLRVLTSRGAREFVYASPFCGFAQVALEKCAREIGARCTIFAERAPGGGAHTFTELAQVFGARIVLVSTLAEAQQMSSRAERDALVFREILADGSEISHRPSIVNLPLGFDHPEFHMAFRVALEDAWNRLSRLDIKRIWLPVGSGTLAKNFGAVLPSHIELCLVDVGVLPPSDDRIRAMLRLPNTRYVRSPESFFEEAIEVPPIPSNKHYDAKLWSFLTENAANGDLWWNVAR